MDRHRRQHGFTLLELVLVLLIISVALAIAAPSLSGWGRGAKLRDAGDNFLSAARYARTQAVAEGRVYRMNLDPAGQGYWLTVQDGQSFAALGNGFGRRWSMPEGFRLSASSLEQATTPLTTIDFFPTGRTQTAQVRIVSPQGETLGISCPTPAETFALVNPEAPR